ncbi:hypothetical protein AB833_11330 [Chromatiales bacterium (ex Bugula neritina AB1)]|nr:hypothetical protein AB833_11330 [Chromatiales bacterium (ex Bugula neritina AB1)]
MSEHTISKLLDLSRISCGATSTSKKKSLQLIARLMEDWLGIDEDDDVDMDVMDALAARERLGCTGMGHGIAIPHGRVDFVTEPLGALITLDEAVDFDAPDEQPVDVVFGLLMPEDQTEEHLKILASLAKFFNAPENREAIRLSRSPQELIDIIAEAETRNL